MIPDKLRIFRGAGVIGLGTLGSRILGFVRDVAIAAVFGTDAPAQAFVVAFRLPNMLRDLVAEGAASAAVVPVFSSYRAKGEEEEFWRLAWVFTKCATVVLLILTALGLLAAPVLVGVMAPGFRSLPGLFELTVTLTRVMFPYVVLIGLTACAVGLLHSRDVFFATSWGQSMMNVALIVSALWIAPRMDVPVMALGIGVLAGGVLQLGVLIQPLTRCGFRPMPHTGWSHPGLGQLWRLFLPRMFGAAVHQVSVLVNTMLASLAAIVGAGGVAALYFANRLIQFPLALVGIAVAQASLPAMARHAERGELDALRQILSTGLRVTLCAMIPSTLGLIVLSRPIVELLFERGAFGAYSTEITTSALQYYAIGLTAYASAKLFTAAFYAMHDTKTPVLVSWWTLVLHVLLNVTLMFPLQLGGLALATSVSSVVNCVALGVLLRVRIGGVDGARLSRSCARILAASVLMCGWLFLGVAVRMSPATLLVTAPCAFWGAAILCRVEEVVRAIELAASRWTPGGRSGVAADRL